MFRVNSIQPVIFALIQWDSGMNICWGIGENRKPRRRGISWARTARAAGMSSWSRQRGHGSSGLGGCAMAVCYVCITLCECFAGNNDLRLINQQEWNLRSSGRAASPPSPVCRELLSSYLVHAPGLSPLFHVLISYDLKATHSHLIAYSSLLNFPASWLIPS